MHWPRWIKISTYSPIQATDCHKWTVILWYLHIVQVQLPWENPAMVSSFTTTRMDEETSGCFKLGSSQQQQWAVATKNRKLFIRQSRDTSHLQQRSIEPSASAILKNLNYPGFSSWDDIRYKKNRWGNLFQKVPFLKIHGLFPTLDIRIGESQLPFTQWKTLLTSLKHLRKSSRTISSSFGINKSKISRSSPPSNTWGEG